VDYVIVNSSVSKSLSAAWNACLDSASLATHYTAPEFFNESYFAEKQPFAVLAVQGDTVQGVVTGLFDGNDMRCGDSGSPHICLRRGADPDAVATALASGLRAHASRSTEYISAFSWCELSAFEAAGFRVRSYEPPLCTILLDLSKGTDWLFRQCSETRRNKIRRAIKAGVQVEAMDVSKDFDAYYNLYKHWCGFKRINCQPYDLQRSALASTQNRLALVARHEGQIVGVSTFRFRAPGIVEYAANVSRREETRIRQNDLLLWRGIEWSAQQGSFTHFSMASAHFFLQKFGGQIHPTYRYSLDRTLLRRRDAFERAKSGAARLYRALPGSLKLVAKKVVRRSSDVD